MAHPVWLFFDTDRIPEDAARKMGEKQVRRLPVLDSAERLVGMVAMADLATSKAAEEAADEALRQASKKLGSPRSYYDEL